MSSIHKRHAHIDSHKSLKYWCLHRTTVTCGAVCLWISPASQGRRCCSVFCLSEISSSRSPAEPVCFVNTLNWWFVFLSMHRLTAGRLMVVWPMVMLSRTLIVMWLCRCVRWSFLPAADCQTAAEAALSKTAFRRQMLVTKCSERWGGNCFLGSESVILFIYLLYILRQPCLCSSLVHLLFDKLPDECWLAASFISLWRKKGKNPSVFVMHRISFIFSLFFHSKYRSCASASLMQRFSK